MRRILKALGLSSAIDSLRAKINALGDTLDEINAGLRAEFALDDETEPPAEPTAAEASDNGTSRRRTTAARK